MSPKARKGQSKQSISIPQVSTTVPMIETRTTLTYHNHLFNSASGHYEPDNYLMNQIDEGVSEGRAEIDPGLTGMNNLAADAPINMNTNSGPFDKSFSRHLLRNEGYTPSMTGLGQPMGDAKFLVNRKQSELYGREDSSYLRNPNFGNSEEGYFKQTSVASPVNQNFNDIETME